MSCGFLSIQFFFSNLSLDLQFMKDLKCHQNLSHNSAQQPVPPTGSDDFASFLIHKHDSSTVTLNGYTLMYPAQYAAIILFFKNLLIAAYLQIRRLARTGRSSGMLNPIPSLQLWVSVPTAKVTLAQSSGHSAFGSLTHTRSPATVSPPSSLPGNDECDPHHPNTVISSSIL